MKRHGMPYPIPKCSCCKAKFRQNPALAKRLMSTGGRTLVEASPTDKIWGIALGRR